MENEIAIIDNHDLTIQDISVNPKDLPKYWERDYVVNTISHIKNPKHRMLMEFLWELIWQFRAA